MVVVLQIFNLFHSVLYHFILLIKSATLLISELPDAHGSPEVNVFSDLPPLTLGFSLILFSDDLLLLNNYILLYCSLKLPLSHVAS